MEEYSITLSSKEWEILKDIIKTGLTNTPVGIWKKNMSEYLKLFKHFNSQFPSFNE